MDPILGHLRVKNGTQLITGVQDSFGPCFRALPRPAEVGEIHFRYVEHSLYPDRATKENGTSLENFKILRAVHVNTVRAALRKIGQGSKRLHPGRYWYEVHGD